MSNSLMKPLLESQIFVSTFKIYLGNYHKKVQCNAIFSGICSVSRSAPGRAIGRGIQGDGMGSLRLVRGKFKRLFQSQGIGHPGNSPIQIFLYRLNFKLMPDLTF